MSLSEGPECHFLRVISEGPKCHFPGSRMSLSEGPECHFLRVQNVTF